MKTYSSAAVLEKDVDVVFVLEVVVKLDYVFVVKGSVQLNFSVNLKNRIKLTYQSKGYESASKTVAV